MICCKTRLVIFNGRCIFTNNWKGNRFHTNKTVIIRSIDAENKLPTNIPMQILENLKLIVTKFFFLSLQKFTDETFNKYDIKI